MTSDACRATGIISVSISISDRRSPVAEELFYPISSKHCLRFRCSALYTYLHVPHRDTQKNKGGVHFHDVYRATQPLHEPTIKPTTVLGAPLLEDAFKVDCALGIPKIVCA